MRIGTGKSSSRGKRGTSPALMSDVLPSPGGAVENHTTRPLHQVQKLLNFTVPAEKESRVRGAKRIWPWPGIVEIQQRTHCGRDLCTEVWTSEMKRLMSFRVLQSAPVQRPDFGVQGRVVRPRVIRHQRQDKVRVRPLAAAQSQRLLPFDAYVAKTAGFHVGGDDRDADRARLQRIRYSAFPLITPAQGLPIQPNSHASFALQPLSQLGRHGEIFAGIADEDFSCGRGNHAGAGRSRRGAYLGVAYPPTSTELVR